MSTSTKEKKRIIGIHDGIDKDTLCIVVGAMHGNEPAGVRALELIFKMLEVEPITNPDFQFRGRLIGIKGHLKAFQNGVRYINRDLNRLWTTENIALVQASDFDNQDQDLCELKEILNLVHREIKQQQPKQIIFMDIHTTSADGGIFTIPADSENDIQLATQLYAPVVKGLLQGLAGTSLQYFNTQHLGIPTTAICFEAGQHNDPLSINRAIAAIINLLKAADCINTQDVENQHTKILKDYAKGLPKLTALAYCHKIKIDDNFKMKAGFKNFEPIKKGELLAEDKQGAIYAKQDGYILMPLYQSKGEDGFFVVKDVKDSVI
jgi:succinylglutamate desuccinylase